MDQSWWGAMTATEHVFWIIAVIASTVLAIQLVIACFSGFDLHIGGDLGGHGADVGHHDIGEPHFQLLTVRSIVAFFTLFGWSGLAFYHQHMPILMVIFLSWLCGFLMMVIIAGCFYGLSKLQGEGTLDLNQAKGLKATVYLRIPPLGAGQIKVSLQGRLIEMGAVNNGPEEIPTGVTVVIKEVSNSKATVERA